MVRSKSVMLKSFVNLVRRESGGAQVRCTLYKQVMNLQFVFCGWSMVQSLFMHTIISWNKELYTTFSHSVSFSCLIFLGAFHTSRLLSDACASIYYEVFIPVLYWKLQSSSSLSCFSQAISNCHLPNTRSLLDRKDSVTSFAQFAIKGFLFIKNQLPVPESRSPQVLRQDAFPLPPGPRDACLTRAWN